MRFSPKFITRSREVVEKHAPLATASEDVEYGVQDFTKTVGPRSSVSLGGGQVRLDVIPLDIGKIRWVRFSHTCLSCGSLPPDHFSYSLSTHSGEQRRKYTQFERCATSYSTAMMLSYIRVGTFSGLGKERMRIGWDNRRVPNRKQGGERKGNDEHSPPTSCASRKRWHPPWRGG
jgi:hypothetical protein